MYNRIRCILLNPSSLFYKFSSRNISNNDVIKILKYEGDVAVLSLNKSPVNSLDLGFLKKIQLALDSLVIDRFKGVLITSGCPNVFCAGLDFKELVKPDEERLDKFYGALQDCFIKLYTYSLPTVAVINGHSPAGGCLLSLCCDYRIMVNANNYKIGLNEIKVGMLVPQWLQRLMISTVGYRSGEKAILGSQMFTASEALSLGLVDEITRNRQDAMTSGFEYLKSQISLPSLPREQIKLQSRAHILQSLLQDRQKDSRTFTEFLCRDETQKHIQKYLDTMRK